MEKDREEKEWDLKKEEEKKEEEHKGRKSKNENIFPVTLFWIGPISTMQSLFSNPCTKVVCSKQLVSFGISLSLHYSILPGLVSNSLPRASVCSPAKPPRDAISVGVPDLS